jgi:heme exporter protein C
MVFCLKTVALYFSTLGSPRERILGELIGIFYVHTPAAWVTYLAFGVSVICTMLFLLKKDLRYDGLAENSATIGVFYGAVTILTGSIWANAVWGSYWNWDPRETTTLISEMAYVGYIMLRLSIPSAERKAFSSGIYNVLAFSTVPLSYLSVHVLLSLHPVVVTPTEYRISGVIFQTLGLSVIAETAIYLYLMGCLYSVTRLTGAARQFGAGD